MHNLPDWFPEVWTTEVTTRAQQKKPAIADTVTEGGTFQGDTLYFPRIGTVEAIDLARLQAVPSLAAPLDWIPVQAQPKFLPIQIWDPDLAKLSIDVVGQFAQAVANGMARSQDKLVVTALHNAATNGVTGQRGNSAEASAAPATENVTTLGDYNTVMDLDLWAEAYAKLGTQLEDGLDGEEVTFVQPFKLNVNMALDPYMAKSDVKEGKMPWDKARWRSYERLPYNGAIGDAQGGVGADCFLYTKASTKRAYNKEMTPINERLGHVLANMFGQWYQGGAAVVEPKAIIRIKTKMDFNLARKAIPIIDVGA